MEELWVGILVASFFAFIIFLILRELMCWYWKINKIVTILENIQSSLIVSKNKAEKTNNSEYVENLLTPDIEICPFCKEPSIKADKICNICGKIKR